jgi:hypothetical protein
MFEPKMEREVNGGVQKIYTFENGYGASVVRHSFSYGGDKGLWELAVLRITSQEPLEWHTTYDTPVTNDVLGYLSVEDVEHHLKEISELEKEEA